MIKVYTDAAVNGNPGEVGLGILLVKDGEQFPFKLLDAQQHQEELIFIHTDSKVAADAILKNYTKREDNRIVLQEIQRQLKQFLQVFIKWIPESDNRGADQLARQALQQRLTHQ